MTAIAREDVRVVEIGGIPISLLTVDDRFRDVLSRRYQGFLSARPAKFELRVELSRDRFLPDDGVRVRREGAYWRVERLDFCAQWDPASGRGWVQQNPNPYSLDSVLRIVHSLVLTGQGGFLLHAASVVCERRAYLFSGVSGAGKTTMARLAPVGIRLLTDEISYVRASADGYRAYGTPFVGDLAKSGENCAAPIQGLFFLEKGPENRLDLLSASESVRRLMRNILFFAEDRELSEKLFATACDFVRRVPVRLLTFYPDSRVWDTIRGFEGEVAHV